MQISRISPKNTLLIAAAAAMLHGATAGAAELPSYELMGLPITRLQLQVLGPAHVREQAPVPTLMLDGTPASPHQAAVLTPRPRKTGEIAEMNITRAGSPQR
jgi:hypothetical protein